MKYLTKEQEAVVSYRKSIGYTCEVLPYGNWLCFKGKHKMVINCLGYDTYTGVQ